MKISFTFTWKRQQEQHFQESVDPVDPVPPTATIPPPPIVVTSTPRPRKIPTFEAAVTNGFDPLAIDPPGQQKGSKKNGKKDKRP